MGDDAGEVAGEAAGGDRRAASLDAMRLAQALARVPSSRRRNEVPRRWVDREQRLEYWLGLVAQAVTGRLQAGLAEFGISYAEWGVMAVLARRRHAFHMELARVTGMSKGGVTKMMVRLELQGMVVREGDLDTTWVADFSRAPWELTSLGWSTLHVLEAVADENETHGFGHLPAGDRQALDQLLRALARHHGWGSFDGTEGWRDLRETQGEGRLVSAPSPARRRHPIKR